MVDFKGILSKKARTQWTIASIVGFDQMQCYDRPILFESIDAHPSTRH